MNKVRERIIEDSNYKAYREFSEHKDLIAFVIGAEYFTYDYKTYTELEADFDEAIVFVEKDWLFDLMIKDGIENPRLYLQEEYDYDDSENWFYAGAKENKIVAVDFN